MKITYEYLADHPDEIFVFGDNLERKGHGGAAYLRDAENTYGFVTKKYPSNHSDAHFTPSEYKDVFERECLLLENEIKLNSNKTYLISKLGSGLADKYGIYQKIIEPNLKKRFSIYPNVKFLF